MRYEKKFSDKKKRHFHRWYSRFEYDTVEWTINCFAFNFWTWFNILYEHKSWLCRRIYRLFSSIETKFVGKYFSMLFFWLFFLFAERIFSFMFNPKFPLMLANKNIFSTSSSIKFPKLNFEKLQIQMYL